jgi:hypothetical protein
MVGESWERSTKRGRGARRHQINRTLEAKARALGGSWYVTNLEAPPSTTCRAYHCRSCPTEAGKQLLPRLLARARRRAESALVSVVATSYLLGVSTRKMARTPSKLRMIKEVDGLQLPRGKIDRTRFSLDFRSAEEAGPCPIPAPRPRCSRS